MDRALRTEDRLGARDALAGSLCKGGRRRSPRNSPAAAAEPRPAQRGPANSVALCVFVSMSVLSVCLHSTHTARPGRLGQSRRLRAGSGGLQVTRRTGSSRAGRIVSPAPPKGDAESDAGTCPSRNRVDSDGYPWVRTREAGRPMRGDVRATRA